MIDYLNSVHLLSCGFQRFTDHDGELGPSEGLQQRNHGLADLVRRRQGPGEGGAEADPLVGGASRAGAFLRRGRCIRPGARSGL